SGAVETLMRPVTPRLRTVAIQVPVLVGATMLLSMVTKNVGALAIMMPVALQIARRTGTPPAALLMPMATAAMVGGVVTLVGTAPNIIMSRVREELTGKPFGMFDYTPVGLGICAMTLLYLTVGWRLLPGGRKGVSSMEAAFNMGHYTLEARVPEGAEAVGMTVAMLTALGEDEVQISAILPRRGEESLIADGGGIAALAADASVGLANPNHCLAVGEGVMLRGEAAELERLVAVAGLMLAGAGPVIGAPDTDADDLRVVEGVVTGDSPLVGRTPAAMTLRTRHGFSLLAISRRGKEQLRDRIAQMRLRVGDVVLLRGIAATMPDKLGELRILPLAERAVALGRGKR
ncbi:MAG: SLC13 family permease, partial [Acetobacteraceae bacterium]